MKSMQDAQQIAFYITQPVTCNYLPDQRSVTVFADPQATMSTHTYSALVDLGFRRSGHHVYVPHCPSCNGCISARIPADAFEPSRSQRRTWKLNQDIEVRCVSPGYYPEHYRLYQRYVKNRHQGGGMEEYGPDQYVSFVTSMWGDTSLYEFRLEERLLAVAVVDHLEQGMSAVYTFFDPAHNTRSLGTYAILWQIEEGRRLKLPYIYLGYYIRNCAKMKYKSKFQPLELLVQGHWQVIAP